MQTLLNDPQFLRIIIYALLFGAAYLMSVNYLSYRAFVKVFEQNKFLQELARDETSILVARDAIKSAQDNVKTLRDLTASLKELNKIQDKNYEWVRKAVENNESLTKANQDLIKALNK